MHSNHSLVFHCKCLGRPGDGNTSPHPGHPPGIKAARQTGQLPATSPASARVQRPGGGPSKQAERCRPTHTSVCSHRLDFTHRRHDSLSAVQPDNGGGGWHFG